ncbi:MAG: DUF4198 domain-containing protein [Planctomycetota bacterium]
MKTPLYRPWMLLCAAAVSTALAADPSSAFLTPGQFAVTPGATVAVHFDVGEAGTARPASWPADRIEWLFVRGGPTQTNRHEVRADDPQSGAVDVKIEHPGVTLVGVDQRPVVLNLTGDEWRAFLRANVAESNNADAAHLPAASHPVRVRHVVSSKTLIRAARADGQVNSSPIATGKSGQAVEIRPLFDPTAIRPGSDLPMRLYVDGDKCVGARGRATHVPSGHAATFVTDREGSAFFRVTEPGLWRVEFHHASPRTGDPAADWNLYTATLTFEVQKGAGQ